MKILAKLLSVVVGVFVLTTNASAITYKVPTDGSRLVGQLKVVEVPKGNVPLEQIAAEEQMGLSNMLEANYDIDPYSPKAGSEVIIPAQLILPDTVHEGIIINSAEMRLYYYHDGVVDVLPIGIGQLGKDTPVDWVTKIQRKKDGPTWTPTAEMRKEYAAKGEVLPAVIPAGKDNPMGLYALYVGKLYALHGTNANFGIGLRVSHGCVRLRDADIKFLFDNVPINTRVEFINEPVKYTVEPNGGIYIEVHHPLSTTEAQITSSAYSPIKVTEKMKEFFQTEGIDKALLHEAFNVRSGIPVMLNPISF